jgi:hypothetical protein
MVVNAGQSRVWFTGLSFLFIGVCVLILCNAELSAQDIKKQAHVAIEVKDQSGAPIPQAQIEIRPYRNEHATKLSTDGNGRLAIDLPSGSYELAVTSRGFKNVARHVEVQETGVEPR